MKPLASTVRTVEWDELPARARDIPFAFNPFEDGVLMAHQAECLSYDVSILAILKAVEPASRSPGGSTPR